MFIPNGYAINYYDSVKFKAAFSEEINLEEIKEIEIAYVDQTNYTKYLILTKESNFESILKEVPNGTINVEYGIVNNDTIGYYNISADVYDNYDNTIDVIVNVKLQNNVKNEEIKDDVKKDIIPSGNSSNSSSTTTSNSTGSTTVSSNNNAKTTTKSSVRVEDEEEIRKQEEKKIANRRKSNLAGTILFSIIGLTVLIAGIYAAIKISQANK